MIRRSLDASPFGEEHLDTLAFRAGPGAAGGELVDTDKERGCMSRYGLTVDWDYFVPEKYEWDIGHAETAIHMSLLWQTRFYLFDKIKVVPAVDTFWQWVQRWANVKPASLWVSDSHASAITDPGLREVDTLILVDQHHDCWPHKRKSDFVYCDTWLRGWLENDDTRHVIWVRPSFDAEYIQPKDAYPIPRDMRDRFTCTTQEDFSFKDVTLNAINICRSGAWTPPWLDDRFIAFINELGLPVGDLGTLQDGDILKALVPRWTIEQLKTYREFGQQQIRIFEEMRERANG